MNEELRPLGEEASSKSEKPPMSHDERHRALQKHITASRMNAIPRMEFHNSGEWTFIKQRRQEPSMKRRQMPIEDAAVVSDWASKVIESSVLQSPEFQDAFLEQRNINRYRNDRFSAEPESVLYSSVRFTRGGIDWKYSGGLKLIAEKDDIKEEIVGGGKQVAYLRVEEMGDSVAFLFEENTDQALAGIEDLVTRLRESGDLRPFPHEYLDDPGTVWGKFKRLDMGGSIKRAIPLGSSLLYLAHNPTLQSAAAAGITAGYAAYKAHQEITGPVKARIADFENRIAEGEFVREYPPR